MTTTVDIVNQALQAFGSRTTVQSLTENSNEAIQANLILTRTRDALIRMAPWNCVTKYANLTYVSSQAGTPENPNQGPNVWVPGLPAIPWTYEYQYPVDCCRFRYIYPQFTALQGGVPIYPAGVTTGALPLGWAGPAQRFNVTLDQFFGVTAAAVASGGSGYNVGDIITLAQPSYTFTPFLGPTPIGTQIVTMPVGAPAQLLVTGVSGGAVTTVSVINQVAGESNAIGGSYFSTQNPTGVGQSNTSGLGSGATFNLTFGSQGPQRVILTNQEAPVGCYNQQITDPNVMDQHFQDAWVYILGARLCKQLTGDKALANMLVQESNAVIMEARKSDGNEDLLVNDVTPDFIAVRGWLGGPNWEYSPNASFDWGGVFAPI